MMEDRLRLEYVPLTQAVLWDRNPKLHDKPGIKASFRRHGFKDPPKYEPELNDGRGGIVEGNGRIVCLNEMMEAGSNPPRGIIPTKDTGEWTVPILFGVDARSTQAAEAYAVDHNNLTMAGFDPASVALMWDQDSYLDLLDDIYQDTVSVSPEGLSALHDAFGGPPSLDDLADELGESDESSMWPFIKVQVPPTTFDLYSSLMAETRLEDRGEAMTRILEAVDVGLLSGGTSP